MALIAARNKPGQTVSRETLFPARSAIGKRTLSALELAALVPPAIVVAFERGTDWLWVIGIAVFVTLIWQRVFAEARGLTLHPDGLIVAVACAIILPASAPLWQVVLTLTFGIVVGQEIFGTRGHNFLNPATVALAFFVFSFPASPLEPLSPAIGLAVVPGALLLLAGGVISWRILFGTTIGLAVGALIIAGQLPAMTAAFAGILFGTIFFAADPTAAASTNPGRWLHGVLFGVTSVALIADASTSINAVISAALIASLFAPLIDSAVIALKAYQRDQRNA